MMHPSLLAGAAGIAAGALSLTPVSFLAPLPIFLIGMSSGWSGAAIGAAAATVVVALVAGMSLAILFVIMQGGPPVLLVRQALLSRAGPNGTEWYPAGHLLAWLSGYAALVLLLVAVFFPDQAADLLRETRALYLEALGTITKGSPSQELQTAVTEFMRWLFAAAAGGWMIMMVVNGTLAQSLLVRLGKNIRPGGTNQGNGLDLPIWLLAALAIAATIAWTWQSGGVYGKAWLVIFALPFAIYGLVRLHGLSRLWPKRYFALTVLYGVIFFLFPWSMMALAGWGVVEQLVRTWRQTNDADNGQEKE